MGSGKASVAATKTAETQAERFRDIARWSLSYIIPHYVPHFARHGVHRLHRRPLLSWNDRLTTSIVLWSDEASCPIGYAANSVGLSTRGPSESKATAHAGLCSPGGRCTRRGRARGQRLGERGDGLEGEAPELFDDGEPPPP